MKLTRLFGAVLLATAIMSTSHALADDTGFYVRTGPAVLILSEGATMTAGGALVPGATIHVDSHVTGTLEVGYSFTPNLSIGFTGGFPPSIDIDGAGTIAGLGKLGEVTYGPTALTLQYSFTDFGGIRPYIGAGPMFMFIFDSKDGVLSNLKVDPSVGFVLQAGVDIDITDTWGVYADVKKGWLKTDATASLGGAPITADVDLDPLVVGGGIKVRF